MSDPPDADADADDIRHARAGDREAFGRLYDRHADGVRAVVAAVAADWGAVEDLTQETFLRSHARLGRLRDPSRFGPWVRGVARYVAREHRVAARRRRTESLAAEPPADAGANEVERRDEEQRVLEAVAQLPERERLAVHSYYFTDRRPEDAAAVLGVSRSGFYAVLTRAVSRLRTRLRARPSGRTNKEVSP